MKALTPKQEAFCQKYVECGAATDAYRHAYDTNGTSGSIKVTAHRLLHTPHVAARVAELRAEALKRHRATVDDIADQLDEDRKFAREQENPGAAVSATMGKAKLLGMLTEKHEHNVILRIEDARKIIADLAPKLLGKGK